MNVGNEPVPPDPNSVEIMQAIDGMSPAFRKLVHEYGFVIVRNMRDEGITRARDLKPILAQWRERRQQQWLQTNYIISRKSFRLDA